jgi:hypothetical protein
MTDFTKVSLQLFCRNKLVFSSDGSGLRPLVECIHACKGKYAECTLQDKIVGLAAAKLIIYAGFITSVHAGTVSEPAKSSLLEHKIALTCDSLVKNICNKDRTDLCPMEKMAMAEPDLGQYWEKVNASLTGVS